MWVMAHMGIGNKLASPWAGGLARRWIILGTILPDLLDKPLYYGLVLATGRHASQLGLISGTQTFGHTALLWLALGLLGLATRSRVLAALTLGGATHLLLDGLAEHLFSSGNPQFLYAVLFPFGGYRFPVIPYSGFGEHLRSVLNPYLIAGETIGAALLLLEWRKTVAAPRRRSRS